MRLLKIANLRRALAFAVPLVVAAWVLPALAEEPVETAVKAWVAAIDASPGWQAAYAGLAVDPATGKATLSGLTVKSRQPGFSLAFTSVVIAGFHPTTDGTFAADEIDLDGGDIEAGAFSLHIAGAAIAAPVLPETGGFVWNSADPFVSAIQALAPLTRSIAASATVGSIAVVETISGVQTRTAYDNVKIAGWRNGKVAAVSAGPVKTESPSPDPLVTMSMDTTETRDVDLNAFIAIYDPAAYAGGIGDGVWRPAIGHVAYHNLSVGIPGVTITIGDSAIDGFRLRQPKVPPLQAEAADAPTDPVSALLHDLDALTTYGMDRFAMSKLNVAIPGLDRAHLDGLTVSDFSGQRIGDLTLSGLGVTVSGGGGTLNVGKFALGGLTLPTSDTLRAALAAKAAGGNVSYSSLVPPLTYVELGGVDEALAAVPPVQLGRFRLDLGNYADKVPTTIGLDVAGVDVPASLIPEERARALLGAFGYDRIHVDAGAHVDWSADGDIAVKDFRLAAKDMGGVSGSAGLTGIKPADAAHLAAIEGAAGALSLKGGTFTFTDDSIVGHALDAQAARISTDPAKFRQQFATGLPFMLMFLNDRALQAELAPVLQAFVRSGGSITAVASPPAPVPLPAIIAAAQTAPFTLFSLLSAKVSGTPGPAATPNAPAN